MERTHFEEGLRELRGEWTRLAESAQASVALALQSLFERQADLAQQVVNGDAELGETQIRMDSQALQLLALQQPIARDLRFIVAAVKADADLERIGDHAVNIGQVALAIVASKRHPIESTLERMAGLASGMVRDAVKAFEDGDAALARQVLAGDDEVDQLQRVVINEVLETIRNAPETTEQGVSLILVSRNLERIADHATNIAEDTIFLVEARDVRHMPGLPPAHAAS